MTLEFYLNGNMVNPPTNWKELSIELDFTKESLEPTVKTTKWIFADDEADTINTYIQQGLTGGYGITEGLPFLIKEQSGLTIFDGYLDLMDTENEYSCYSVTANAKETGKIDWLNTTADGFTFAYLYDLGLITDSNFHEIPYVVSAIPDYANAASLAITLFIIVESLLSINEKALDLGIDLANPLTSANAIAKLAVFLIYLISLMAAIIVCIDSLIDNIIQLTKYHRGMYVRDLINAACGYLQLGFSSTILNDANSIYYNSFIIPEKTKKGKNILGGSTQMGYYNGTFGELLRALKIIFAVDDIMINNGVLYFEQRSYWNVQANWTMPDVRNDWWAYNVDELQSNYLIAWTLDSDDYNTYDSYDGTVCQIITTQLAPLPLTKRSGLTNLTMQTIPFSRAIRKESLTGVEQVFNVILQVVGGLIDVIINLVGGSSTLANNIAQRIGYLLLSTDFVTIPKFFIEDNGELSQFNATYTQAAQLWAAFHIINSFVPSVGYPNANQYLLYKNTGVPFCLGDYNVVKDNNMIYTVNGESGQIDTVEWNLFDETATINYRVNKLYTKNLQETQLIDAGL